MQLPDYHEVIEHPMDFSTVRKKLSNGAYASLEAFEVGLYPCDCILKKSDIAIHSVFFFAILFVFGLFSGILFECIVSWNKDGFFHTRS